MKISDGNQTTGKKVGAQSKIHNINYQVVVQSPKHNQYIAHSPPSNYSSKVLNRVSEEKGSSNGSYN